MQILLLRVTGLALEAHIAGLSINQHLASENTHACAAISKAVQQRCLASSRNAH
jgi:hypothetical protein